MFQFLKYIKRNFKFYFLLRPKHSKIQGNLGKLSLCSNPAHPFHLSQFEADTCKVLQEFFPSNNILIPLQHKCRAQFDFVIPDIAVIEPHGVWDKNYTQDNFESYYRRRKTLALQEDLTRSLPVIVLRSRADLYLMVECLIKAQYQAHRKKKPYFNAQKIMVRLEQYLTGQFRDNWQTRPEKVLFIKEMPLWQMVFPWLMSLLIVIEIFLR